MERITPPWLQFRVLGKSTDVMQTGTRIDYRLKIRGVPVRWQSVIDEWSPGSHFVDYQSRGPYALWHHTHRFQAHGNRTLMIDEIHFKVPGGVAGEWLVGWWVKKDIQKIFAFRRAQIEAYFAESRK